MGKLTRRINRVKIQKDQKHLNGTPIIRMSGVVRFNKTFKSIKPINEAKSKYTSSVEDEKHYNQSLAEQQRV